MYVRLLLCFYIDVLYAKNPLQAYKYRGFTSLMYVFLNIALK